MKKGNPNPALVTIKDHNGEEVIALTARGITLCFIEALEANGIKVPEGKRETIGYGLVGLNFHVEGGALGARISISQDTEQEWYELRSEAYQKANPEVAPARIHKNNLRSVISWSATGRSLATAITAVKNYQKAIEIVATFEAKVKVYKYLVLD